MPVHDWTRVSAGTFHDFHTSWVIEIRNTLNTGVLPPDYYAQAEQVAGSVGPDVLTLRTEVSEGNGAPAEVPGTTAVGLAPPPVRFTLRAEVDEYALKQRTLVIRHSSNHRIIALIEILSPGNKGNRHAIRQFLDKVSGALGHGIHLLLIDLFPPGPRDPQGIHGAIWAQLSDEPYTQPADKPLTLVAYSAGPVKVAYVEPTAVGDTLPEMALFLTPDEYVKVPLEPTYQAAWRGTPRYYRNILEAP
jgi:hypothetical protein